jgi:hypothetical protein
VHLSSSPSHHPGDNWLSESLFHHNSLLRSQAFPRTAPNLSIFFSFSTIKRGVIGTHLKASVNGVPVASLADMALYQRGWLPRAHGYGAKKPPLTGVKIDGWISANLSIAYVF